MVLGVDVDQFRGEFLQNREIDGGVIDERPRFPALGNFPTNDGIILIIKVVLLKKRSKGKTFDVKNRFHGAFFRLVEEHAQIGTIAQNQGKSTHNDGLSRSGFTRDDRHPFVKTDL